MKLYDNRDYFKIYTGGQPEISPKPNHNLKDYDWQTPQDPKTFYAIHNGFGERNSGNFILANEDISVMAELMDPICKEKQVTPKGYSFIELLEFCPDSAGNAQCFYKNGSNITVDWDHELWEISWETEFFDFVDNRLDTIDEE